jgi:Lrp/AsnC family transcriptional regulator, leucine-responsive regulatory protein
MQNLDHTDIALLRALTSNARQSHVELASLVGLSSTACARRLVALEQEGLIEGYQAVLGLKALGLGTTVIVRITLESQSEDALKAFEIAAVKCQSVVRCLLMSGSDDYLLTVLARDIEDFEYIHKTQLSRLPRVARIHSSFAIRDVVNRSFPPAALAPADRPKNRKRS